MIISPPFLPEEGSANHANDNAFIESTMLDSLHRVVATGGAPAGSYPLGSALTWHNGVHLMAPSDAKKQGRLPVRAIADGTVIFVRAPKPRNNATEDPLNYNPFGPEPSWTDNGIVIIRHATDIGAEGNTPTSLTYFSVYMHLESIESTVAENKPIWRKDKIGAAGQIFGMDHQIHFEICMDAANLQRLVGANRPITWTEPSNAPTADGRTDSVFGSTYIFLPAGTPTSSTSPTNHLRRLKAGASAATDHFVPDTLRKPQWVEISYSKGQGTVRSYSASLAKGSPAYGSPIGQALQERDFEYDLYTEANKRHNSLDAAMQGLSSPSGWYELLRFGRNLGPDRLPENIAHWRQIPTAGGALWADLNAEGTFKFSDADFPAFKGWQFFDDDESHDNQRCDSIELKRLIRDPEVQESIRDRAALAKRLGKTEVRDKLKRTICKFPTEWDANTIAERYDWLKVDEEFKIGEGDGWSKFYAHCQAISFHDLPQEYRGADWHVHPHAFIAEMRKCGWLSATEFAQCFPRKLKHLTGTSFRLLKDFPWVMALERATRWTLHLNTANRKYGVDRRQRLAHYLAQVIPETEYLSNVKELDNKTGTYLKSKAYYPYYGRGLIQLTWNTAYKDYGKFRRFSITEKGNSEFTEVGWNPNSLLVESNSKFHIENCADSGGFFINWKPKMLKRMDSGIQISDSINVSKSTNGEVAEQNLNGLDSRLQGTLIMRDILLDMPADEGLETINFDWRRSSAREPTGSLDKNGKAKLAYIKRTWSLDVVLEKQRP